MENASKGLLISAAVLIVILIVTISIKILSPIEGTKEKAEEIGETMSGASRDAIGKLQSSIGIQTIGKAEVDKKASKNSTINGQIYGSKNPIIPEGFIPIDTDTSKWGDGKNAPEVDNGLVIKDADGNEFVWVPVTTKIEPYGLGTSGNREPDVITGVAPSSYYDAKEDYLKLAGCTKDLNKDNIVNAYDLKIQLTNEFKEMAASVNKYGGFYVGRYETSINGSKVQSRRGVESATAEISSANTWYGFYKLQKTYITSSVRSSMIWGSQYDAMMTWMGNAANTTYETNIKKNTTRVTGNKPEDIIKNIYDLYGNSLEWTLEANASCNRSTRGGVYYLNIKLNNRGNANPQADFNDLGSRLTLYLV